MYTMIKCSDTHEQICPIEIAVGQLSGKWKIVILHRLIEGQTLHFSELKRSIPGVTQRMLIAQLRELEDAGLVARKVYKAVPPKVEYRVTTLGESLGPVLELLETWGRAYEQTRLGQAAKEGVPQTSSSA
jgi:DNA-binding HxlR family transcriptional regulator